MKVREAYAAVFPAGDVLHEGPSFAYVVREIEATGIFQLLTQPCPKARFAPPEVKLVVSEHRCPFRDRFRQEAEVGLPRCFFRSLSLALSLFLSVSL